MDAYDAYLPCTRNSLILKMSSLFPEIFSLLICVGNFAKSRCSAAVSCYEIGLGSPRIPKFPVKFPVSRELTWRRVRSPLRCQPASHSGVRPDFPRDARMGRKSRLFAHSVLSPASQLANPGPAIAESLQPRPRKFPFWRDDRRRLGAITTAARPRHSISTRSPALIALESGIPKLDCRMRDGIAQGLSRPSAQSHETGSGGGLISILAFGSP